MNLLWRMQTVAFSFKEKTVNVNNLMLSSAGRIRVTVIVCLLDLPVKEAPQLKH
jgi:hypothetical protein